MRNHEGADVCDRIAVMFRGNIVEMGTVEQVLMNSRQPYSRLLRESIPEADPKKRWTSTVSLTELEHQEYYARDANLPAAARW